jgi:hypothetical protein
MAFVESGLPPLRPFVHRLARTPDRAILGCLVGCLVGCLLPLVGCIVGTLDVTSVGAFVGTCVVLHEADLHGARTGMSVAVGGVTDIVPPVVGN